MFESSNKSKHMKTKHYKGIKMLTMALISTAFAGNSLACDLSGFTLNSVTNLGNNRYKTDVTFCAGAGRNNTRYGADQGTTYFSFYLSNNCQLDTWSHDTLISPATSNVFKGYKLYDDSHLSVPYNTNALFYIGLYDQDATWCCIDWGCGAPRSVCRSISIYTIGLPDTIWLRGMEAAGNTLGGCTDLRIFPRCHNVSVVADAGADKTVYPGGSPSSATLSGSASGGTSPYSYLWSNNATTSSITVSPIATTTYSLQVADAWGCRATDQVVVTKSCAQSTLVASAGSDKNIYIGTGTNCVALSGTSTGGYGTKTYLWSTNATTANINVCPTVTTSYSLTVTDGYACTSTDQTTVKVTDIRCGTNKINVCYNGRTKCIRLSDLSWYQTRGATLGACNGPAPLVESDELTGLQVFPNPSTDKTFVSFTGAGLETNIELYNSIGQKIKTIYKGIPSVNEAVELLVDVADLKPGLYFVKHSINGSVSKSNNTIYKLIVE